MRHLFIILGLAVFIMAGNLFAQDSLQVRKKNQQRNNIRSEIQLQNKAQQKNRFMDENGDGFNDNAPDHDGDGIPNGRDKDYTGLKAHKGNPSKGFIDEDGDGLNDNAMDADGDGIPNGQDEDYTRPLDGSGNKHTKRADKGVMKAQKGAMGSGDCDGSGPKGNGGKKQN